MKVTGINSTQTPSFGVKIPTKELIGFICKSTTTDNKFASSAITVTKLSNGKIQGLHTPVMDMWQTCCDFAEKIRTKYPELKEAADSVDKYSVKILNKKKISIPEYLQKIDRKLKSFEKKLGKEYDIKDFE